MRTRQRSYGPWFALAAAATFVYGVESWRRNASRRASTGEQARFHAAVTCLLGADGARLAYSPGEARQRLRALAMDTALAPAPSWIDRCVPLLRDLAVHGAEVDVTQDLRSAPTAVARHARELALATARVGLVWEIRAGDPETDMEHIAELLVRTATEIDLASADLSIDTLKGPRAPVPRPMPATARLDTGGLLPLPSGTPTRFLVGAPLPFISAVSVHDGALRAEALANDDARWWRVVPQGVVRVLPDERASDGLSPVSLDGPSGSLGVARIAAPPATLDPRVVSLDAVARGRVLWLAEAVRGNSPVLARLPFAGSHAEATAARLSRGPRVDSERGDEEVAVAADGDGVVAAYTEHVPGAGMVDVRVVRAAGGARAAVREVPTATSAWQLGGRRPALGLCATPGAMWLFAASNDEWRVGVVGRDALTGVGRVTRAGTRRFDETLTLRCAAHGVVAYARERPRSSPMWRCAMSDGVPRCETLPALPSTQPRDLDPWTTFSPTGERRAHPEWPLSLAFTGYGTVLAARTSGSIIAVARLPRGATQWEPERVVFDAARDEPGAIALGAELYTDGARTLLVMSDATDLRATRTDDDGESWRAP